MSYNAQRIETTSHTKASLLLSRILVDADACPVKQEIYRVAKRYGWSVTLVANTVMQGPKADWLDVVVVKGHADAADNWIAENATATDVVITSDIPLAARCLEKEAAVLDSRGGEFTDASIGSALATRQLMDQLRAQGATTGGPAPFQPRDRSQFLQALDRKIQELRQHQSS